MTAHMRGFRLYSIDELRNCPAATWLITEILEHGIVGCLFGPSGEGKTFVALDLALSVATGRSWHGHATVRGSVVYVVAEGSRGISKRVQAWLQHQKVATVSDMFFTLEAVQLRSGIDVDSFLGSIKERGLEPALIILDTLAQCLVGGEENSAKDMGEAVAAARRLSRETGAAVLLVHHSGRRGGRNPRGSSALQGNVDVVFSVRKTPAGRVTIKSVKQKDHPPFHDITLRLQSVPLEEGESSYVLVSPAYVRGTPVGSRSHPTRSESQHQALTVLSDSGDDGLKVGDWRRAVGRARDCEVSEKTFDNWRQALLEQGLIEAVPGKRYHYRLTQAARDSILATPKCAMPCHTPL